MGLFRPNIKKLENKGDIDGLVKGVKHSNPTVKNEAIKALEKNPDVRAIVPLFNCWYHEKTKETKDQLRNVLVSIGKQTGAKPLIKLFETYDDKKDTKFRCLYSILIKIGDVDSIEPLFIYTSNKDPGSDPWALTMMISKIGGDIADGIMREILNGTRNGGNIDQAARYFAKKREKSVVPDLISLLKSVENEHTKQAIAYSLGEIGDERAVEPLISALIDKREKVAYSVVGALKSLNDVRAIEPLKKVIEDDKSHPLVREVEGPSAVRKLSKLKTTEDVKSRIERLLPKLPVIKEENISDYRQKMANQSRSIHPSMFLGSISRTVDFVTRMVKETESFILSCEGVIKVKKAFLISSGRPINIEVLEIQYEQFGDDGDSSIYSEHVMRIGTDTFEVFGSEKSAARMAAVLKE